MRRPGTAYDGSLRLQSQPGRAGRAGHVTSRRPTRPLQRVTFTEATSRFPWAGGGRGGGGH